LGYVLKGNLVQAKNILPLLGTSIVLAMIDLYFIYFLLNLIDLCTKSPVNTLAKSDLTIVSCLPTLVTLMSLFAWLYYQTLKSVLAVGCNPDDD
jgi:hypothetical protein